MCYKGFYPDSSGVASHIRNPTLPGSEFILCRFCHSWNNASRGRTHCCLCGQELIPTAPTFERRGKLFLPHHVNSFTEGRSNHAKTRNAGMPTV